MAQRSRRYSDGTEVKTLQRWHRGQDVTAMAQRSRRYSDGTDTHKYTCVTYGFKGHQPPSLPLGASPQPHTASPWLPVVCLLVAGCLNVLLCEVAKTYATQLHHQSCPCEDTGWRHKAAGDGAAGTLKQLATKNSLQCPYAAQITTPRQLCK